MKNVLALLMKLWLNNNKDNITNNNTYLILFIVFLIGFIYYYCRNNANKRKLRDFIYPKIKTSTY